MGRISGNEARVPRSPGLRAPLSPDFRQNSPTTTLLTAPVGLGTIDSYERYDRHSAMDDARSLTNITEPDSFHEDPVALELDPSKVVHLNADPANMPRLYPQNAAEGDTANMKAALISAVRNKNHKLVEQLLHRGASTNTGPNIHALKEAVLTHDQESIRLLLLFGADPNSSDRDGITPLLASVEKSSISSG